MGNDIREVKELIAEHIDWADASGRGHCEVNVNVLRALFADYDALEAENKRLREALELIRDDVGHMDTAIKLAAKALGGRDE